MKDQPPTCQNQDSHPFQRRIPTHQIMKVVTGISPHRTSFGRSAWCEICKSNQEQCFCNVCGFCLIFVPSWSVNFFFQSVALNTLNSGLNICNKTVGLYFGLHVLDLTDLFSWSGFRDGAPVSVRWWFLNLTQSMMIERQIHQKNHIPVVRVWWWDQWEWCLGKTWEIWIHLCHSLITYFLRC